MLIYGEDEVIANWVERQIPHVHNGFGPNVTIGYANPNGQLRAGFVFHYYSIEHETICLTVAATSPMWARHETIHEILSYPFEQLKIYKVYTITPADNHAALKVNAHIGFQQEAILAHHFGRKRHAVIRRLLRPDYLRLFGERDGRRIQERTRHSGPRRSERTPSSGEPSRV